MHFYSVLIILFIEYYRWDVELFRQTLRIVSNLINISANYLKAYVLAPRNIWSILMAFNNYKMNQLFKNNHVKNQSMIKRSNKIIKKIHKLFHKHCELLYQCKIIENKQPILQSSNCKIDYQKTLLKPTKIYN